MQRFTIARSVESIMLAFDDLYYRQRDANIDTTVTKRVVSACERLTFAYQTWTRDCPFCFGVVGDHDADCVLTRHAD
jgi:hypothetical protein